MTELRKEFKKYHPETVGETDKAFDDSNYIDWLEKELTEARNKLKNNGDSGAVMRCASCKYFTTGHFAHNTNVFHPEDGYHIENVGADNDYGICLNEKVASDYVDDWTKRKVNKSSDAIYATCDEGRGHLEVGKDFGCIHWHSA